MRPHDWWITSDDLILCLYDRDNLIGGLEVMTLPLASMIGGLQAMTLSFVSMTEITWLVD